MWLNVVEQVLLHRKGTEFTEIGIFLDQEFFALRPRRLLGEFSFGSLKSE